MVHRIEREEFISARNGDNQFPMSCGCCYNNQHIPSAGIQSIIYFKMCALLWTVVSWSVRKDKVGINGHDMKHWKTFRLLIIIIAICALIFLVSLVEMTHILSLAFRFSIRHLGMYGYTSIYIPMNI